MNKSESIKELAIALAKVHSVICNPKKNSVNPFFKSKYANLEEVINVSKPILAENGLSIVQFPSFSNGLVSIETVLLHESGEYISDVLSIPVNKPDEQGVGKAISYGRRYALSAICGLAQEDEDGNKPNREVPEKPFYSEEDFKANYPKWLESISDGKATAEKIISAITSRYQLTGKQIEALNNVV